MAPVAFRIARHERELEQLHALHYRAFVEEIPQHAANPARIHVDRFHDQNTYVVAVDGETVIGSVAVRTSRPFSLDGKLADLDAHLPPGRRFCEVRLLNIAPRHRHGDVLPGLLAAILELAARENIDAAVISATTRQLRLYSRLGFAPFGPLVGTAEASFQPMYVTLERLREHARQLTALPPVVRGEVASFLSGPVPLHPDVRRAWETEPESHRGPAFTNELRAVKASLCTLTGAANVAMLLGSGTLANDVVAAQLAGLPGRGVVFSNGEFGERLVDHAQRAGLEFEHRRFGWGEPLDLGTLDGASWVWGVACETSAGILNDLTSSGVRLALDCISAVGAVPLDLSKVWLASGTSGKALASYPGLSMVFYQDVAVRTVPRYLDLSLYAGDEVPFTQSSNLVRALNVALARVDWAARYEEIAAMGMSLRRRLRDEGCTLAGERSRPAPHVITIELPAHQRATDVAESLEREGFLICHASGYLRERNWIQICLMGEVPRDALPPLVRKLARMCR